MELEARYKNEVITIYLIDCKYYFMNSKGETREIQAEDLQIIG